MAAGQLAVAVMIGTGAADLYQTIMITSIILAGLPVAIIVQHIAGCAIIRRDNYPFGTAETTYTVGAGPAQKAGELIVSNFAV